MYPVILKEKDSGMEHKFKQLSGGKWIREDGVIFSRSWLKLNYKPVVFVRKRLYEKNINGFKVFIGYKEVSDRFTLHDL